MELWNNENIKAGFDRFFAEHGRLPTSFEVDDQPDLPSARQLQRAFGGLPGIRRQLGYGEIDYTKGELRQAAAAGSRGLKIEQELEAYLIKRFGEVFVHTEKRFGKHKNRVDFMVFSREGVFGIDTFYSADIRAIQNNVNIKLNHYAEFPVGVPLYFACANMSFSEEKIRQHTATIGALKSRPDVHVLGLRGLKAILKSYSRHKDPVGFKPLIKKD